MGIWWGQEHSAWSIGQALLCFQKLAAVLSILLTRMEVNPRTVLPGSRGLTILSAPKYFVETPELRYVVHALRQPLCTHGCVHSHPVASRRARWTGHHAGVSWVPRKEGPLGRDRDW